MTIDLPKILRERREALHMTKKQLAQAARCGECTVGGFERYERSIAYDKLLDIINALGLTIELKEVEE